MAVNIENKDLDRLHAISANANAIIAESTSADARIAFVASGTTDENRVYIAARANSMAIGVNTADVITVESSNASVGINRAVPAAKLDILETTAARGLRVHRNSAAAGDGIEFKSTGTGSALLVTNDGLGIVQTLVSFATDAPLLVFSPTAATNARGDISFLTRTADASGPDDGDMWFNRTEFRLKMQLSGATKTIGALTPLHWGDPAILTLATDVITLTDDSNVVVAAQTGTADDLSTITVPANEWNIGDCIVLTADAGDTITVKHAVDNIVLDGSADKAIVNNNSLYLRWDGSNWLQMCAMMVLP